MSGYRLSIMKKGLHLDIRSQVMLKSLFMALCYNMNHHPEEEESVRDNNFKI